MCLTCYRNKFSLALNRQFRTPSRISVLAHGRVNVCSALSSNTCSILTTVSSTHLKSSSVTLFFFLTVLLSRCIAINDGCICDSPWLLILLPHLNSVGFLKGETGFGTRREELAYTSYGMLCSCSRCVIYA